MFSGQGGNASSSGGNAVAANGGGVHSSVHPQGGVSGSGRGSVELDVDAEVTPIQMLRVGETAGEKWYEIGVYLNIAMPQLENMREKHRDSKTHRLVEVLNNWNRREGRQATVRKLLEVCDKAQVRGAVLKVLQQLSV